MNFFFHTKAKDFQSLLTIPKFQNSGVFADNLNLFNANIVDNKWSVEETSCVEDPFFWTIDCKDGDDRKIYFLATEKEASLIEKRNKLCDLNHFTETIPDYRANLMIKNSVGGFSSYQSEYPFIMTTKLGTLYSDCGMLTSEKCKSVGIFVKNIYMEPIYRDIPFYLYDDLSGKVISTFKLSLNETNFIDLTDFKDILSHCFLFAKNYLGVPIYVIEYEDGNLSFEHTHPPHASIGGSERFSLVNRLKGVANEKIS